jgi:hypothetical protein
MQVYSAVLLGLVLPISISGAVLLGCRLLGRWGGRDRHSRPWGQPIALALGYVFGHAAIHGWPRIPPLDSEQWLPIFAVMAVALGLIDAFWHAPLVVRWLMRSLLSGFVVVRLLLPLMQQEGGQGMGMANVVIVVAIVIAFWINLSLLAEHTPGAPFPAAMMALALTESCVLLISGSVVQGQLGCVLWSTLAGSLLGAGNDPNLSLARGGLPVLVVLLAGLAIDGRYYSDLPLASALLLAAAPLGLWVLQLGPVKRLSPTKAKLIGVGAVLVPLICAVAIAYAASPPMMTGNE